MNRDRPGSHAGTGPGDQRPDRSSFERCKSVFLAVLDQAPSDRPATLERLCAQDTALRDEVAALLAEHDRGDARLDRVAWSDHGTEHAGSADITEPMPVRPGQTLASYAIESTVGTGGMGVVFAARHRVTGQPIALKLIRPGLASAATRRRFNSEGRALARLRHPGIAQIYDAGIARPDEDPHAPAVPYIAMELIRGRLITDAAASLPRAERLRLIEQAARAVHHAHLNGVVHRDLKPANVLVDERGGVKVLDFGIAKLTKTDGPAVTTNAGQIVGTPAYMSPEQLGADPAGVDHRTDVYALGAMLFEVLTGQRPIDTDTTDGLWAVMRRVERGPDRLSTIDPSCRGDLDIITATALRANPAERYQSASELADDIARHLAHHPIRARPRTRRYVLGRLVRRNPWQVALGMIAVFSIAAGTGGVAIKQRQAVVAERRAHARFDETRSLARTVLFDLNDAIERLPGSTPARLLLATTAQSYLDRLADDPAADDELRLEIAEGYTKLGDVLSNSFSPNLGDRDNAIRNWKTALAILEPMAEQPDPPLRVMIATVNALQGMNSVLGFGPAGTLDEVVDFQLPVDERCRDLMARAVAIAPEDPDVARLRDEVALRHALAVWSLRDADAAIEMFTAALLRAEADMARWPAHRRVALIAAETNFWYGYILVELGRIDEAVPLNARAESICRGLAETDPSDARTRQRLSTVIMRSALIAARSGRIDEADARCQEAVGRFERHVAEDPECQYVFRGCNVTHGQAAQIYALLESAADPTDIPARTALAERGLHHARIAADMLGTRIQRGWLWPWETHYDREAIDGVTRAQATLDALRRTPSSP